MLFIDFIFIIERNLTTLGQKLVLSLNMECAGEHSLFWSVPSEKRICISVGSQRELGCDWSYRDVLQVLCDSILHLCTRQSNYEPCTVASLRCVL